MKPFNLKVMTPSKVFYNGEVEMVIATTLSGDEGFMSGHVWSKKLLKISELWVKEKGSAKRQWRIAALHGGIVDMKDDMVIYTDAVEWSEDIDMKRALNEKSTAEDWIVKHEKDEDLDPDDLLLAKVQIEKNLVRSQVASGGIKNHYGL